RQPAYDRPRIDAGGVRNALHDAEVSGAVHGLHGPDRRVDRGRVVRHDVGHRQVTGSVCRRELVGAAVLDVEVDERADAGGEAGPFADAEEMAVDLHVVRWNRGRVEPGV